ncbi:hypothetical protein AVEN_204952-1 [Araneus ventricosus]|uniref:Uncharacterized protein n=1 Tax=Araneus ventricosus TaxID=182803 RepID=A0A4Y2RIZ6_ARAVE|nr:hypothetical protein AVEN_77755-1 [Araneus ventricosus]GBN75406.1 hypothetical protein AVEN_204952-1 [Araneus ventricosus]
MNIIEPIWVALQCAVQKRFPPPCTPTDLRTALQDSWSEKSPGYLQTLVDTMPRRVASLLCANDIRQVYQLFWLFTSYRETLTYLINTWNSQISYQFLVLQEKYYEMENIIYI